MAPSSRNRISKRQAQPDIANAFRATKASKLNVSKQKLDAIEATVAEKERPQPQLPKQVLSSKKRRREVIDSDAENEEATTQRPHKSLRKLRQTQIQILTPPQSSPEPDSVALPETLEELQSLHKSFTQALGVHYAHNGTSNAVSLSALMPAMTRLWKRRTVSVADIERMLAVWEVTATPGREIEHNKGPFRLVISGIGSNQQTKVEYAWTNASGTFIENELHRKYETAILQLCHSVQTNTYGFAFIHEPLITFPRLRCQIGAQTQARKEKINSIRDTIILKQPITQTQTETQDQQPPSEPDFSKLQISSPSDPKPTLEATLKSRTLSLFDRLRAKQFANSTSISLDPATQLRRRALHRIHDLLPILRLKQSQKLNNLFRSDLHSAPSGVGARKMKVSFSLEQLVQEIRDSGRVMVPAEEIRECICILGREVPDGWCSVVVGEGLRCVTLQGEGWRGDEVKSWCDEEIRKIDGK